MSVSRCSAPDDDAHDEMPEDLARWLYTVITRAEKGLVILA
jgi:hypothetical protein